MYFAFYLTHLPLYNVTSRLVVSALETAIGLLQRHASLSHPKTL